MLRCFQIFTPYNKRFGQKHLLIINKFQLFGSKSGWGGGPNTYRINELSRFRMGFRFGKRFIVTFNRLPRLPIRIPSSSPTARGVEGGTMPGFNLNRSLMIKLIKRRKHFHCSRVSENNNNNESF